MADRGRVGIDRVCNKTLHKRLVASHQKIHKDMLHEINTRVKGGRYDTMNNTVPETLSLKHIKYNAKKAEILSLRAHDIESVNHFLLEGIARNMVELSTSEVLRPPKAMTARVRMQQLEEITRQNEVRPKYGFYLAVFQLSRQLTRLFCSQFLAHRLENMEGEMAKSLRKEVRNAAWFLGQLPKAVVLSCP